MLLGIILYQIKISSSNRAKYGGLNGLTMTWGSIIGSHHTSIPESDTKTHRPPKQKKKLSPRPLFQRWQPFFLSASKLWWLSPRYWAHKFHCYQGLGSNIFSWGRIGWLMVASELPHGANIQSISPVSIEKGTCHWRIRTQWGWLHPHL